MPGKEEDEIKKEERNARDHNSFDTSDELAQRFNPQQPSLRRAEAGTNRASRNAFK